MKRASVAVLSASFALGCAPPPRAPPSVPMDDLRAARALDQQGVLSFEAGRYRDALGLFEASLLHGGPSTERWNAARCHLRLDEPEKAEADLAAYLGSTDLTAEDRRDAQASLSELRRRPSTLTVISAPLGLVVSIDGRRFGATPLSVPLAPGDHVIIVHRSADAKDERTVTARLGRTILVESRP